MGHLLRSTEQAVQWLREHVTGTLSSDSRTIQPGDGFIAWPGAAADGRAHVLAAAARGATACLVEDAGAEAFDFGGARVARYRGLKASTGPLAASWFDQPAQQMNVVAVTGTNGKTSTAWWLAQALSKSKHTAAQLCAVVGTLGMGIPPKVVSTGLTTPDPVQLHSTLRQWVDVGVRACAIEASSIGLAEHRLDGLAIRLAVFTNFTQDHLDYHATMDAYWEAKRSLFDWPGLQSAVINVDDAHGAKLAAELSGTALDIWTVSCLAPARLSASHICYGAKGLECQVHEGAHTCALVTPFMGHYNIANLLGVIGSLRALGIDFQSAVAACHNLSNVPGRMECIAHSDMPVVVVDYAHTPDALQKALGALRLLADQRNGKLWCVFGCGGARDIAKRPLMGAVAAAAANFTIVTSDNPRNENPVAIISQICAGVQAGSSGLTTEPDRAVAIAEAIARAQMNDVILVAGKGHEKTQEIAGVLLPFSDYDQVQIALQQWSQKPMARAVSKVSA